ncbi:hypothetical protein FRC03_004511 [Tulasnella sp. 419]|nr:hypothetical protein FRC03_004511 [Tulasnella sp. 419]
METPNLNASLNVNEGERPAPEGDGQVTQETEEEYIGTSQRWLRFKSAFEMVAKQVGQKWTLEDFKTCIPEWSNDDPGSVIEVHRQMSEYAREATLQEGQKIFQTYKAAWNIDRMDEMIQAARQRRREGQPAESDVWSRDITPATAVRARVVPKLREEVALLKKMEEELLAQQKELTDILNSHRTRRESAAKELNLMMDGLEQAIEHLNAVQQEDIQQFGILTEESMV